MEYMLLRMDILKCNLSHYRIQPIQKWVNQNKYLTLYTKFTLFSIIICFAVVAHSQQPELRFKHITTNAGLSNNINIINCIAQDHMGFMWIDTMEGLNRYDGNNFKIFKKDLADLRLLADNMVYDIFRDHRNNIWFCRKAGIVYFWPPVNNAK